MVITTTHIPLTEIKKIHYKCYALLDIFKTIKTLNLMFYTFYHLYLYNTSYINRLHRVV